MLLWSKYCSVCEEDIEGAGKNLLDEFFHMLKHMKEQETNFESKKSSFEGSINRPN